MGTFGIIAFNTDAASTPFILGIATSSTIKSGFSCLFHELQELLSARHLWICDATEFGFNFGLGFPCSSQQLVDVFTDALDIVEWRS